MLTLALNSVMSNLLVVFFLVVCVTMILVVLIQRPQGGGLSGAFGSGGGSSGAGQTAFGTKTGDVLTWTTVSMFVVYIIMAMILNFTARPVDPNANIIPEASSTQTEPSLPAETPAENAAPAPVDFPAEDPADANGNPTEPVSGDSSEPGATDPVIDPAAEPVAGEPLNDPATADMPA